MESFGPTCFVLLELVDFFFNLANHIGFLAERLFEKNCSSSAHSVAIIIIILVSTPIVASVVVVAVVAARQLI